MDITCWIIFTGAKMINGNFLRDGGGCDRYRMWTCGRDSKEGTGLEPSNPMRKVSKCNLAKLSAWYIMRGLLPMSPRTRIATDRGLGFLDGLFNSSRHATPSSMIAESIAESN